FTNFSFYKGPSCFSSRSGVKRRARVGGARSVFAHPSFPRRAQARYRCEYGATRSASSALVTFNRKSARFAATLGRRDGRCRRGNRAGGASRRRDQLGYGGNGDRPPLSERGLSPF